MSLQVEQARKFQAHQRGRPATGQDGILLAEEGAPYRDTTTEDPAVHSLKSRNPQGHHEES